MIFIDCLSRGKKITTFLSGGHVVSAGLEFPAGSAQRSGFIRRQFVVKSDIMSPRKFKYPGDAAIELFLQKHACPMSFVEVRMRFLGEIASPRFEVSPMATIRSCWNGELPLFDGEDQANDFFQTLMGLWNRMTRHQDGVLVKLVKPKRLRDRVDVAAALRMRAAEIWAFLEGIGLVDDATFSAAMGKSLAGLRNMADLLEKIAAKAEEAEGEETPRDYLRMIDPATREVESLLTEIVKASKELRRQAMFGPPGPLH